MRIIAKQYKIAAIFLIVLSFLLSACSGADRNDFKAPPDDAVSAAAQIPEPTPEDSPAAPEETVIETDWASCFDGLNGAAVLYSPAENRYQIYHPELAATRRSPCSTFKIISSLTALEHQILTPEASVRTWSGEVFWNENWNRDIGFEEAFRTSCVWYFRELIDEIGADVLQTELNQLAYGNCDLSDWEGRLNNNNSNRALTGFWIESSLKISPREQVDVLERIFGEESAYAPDTLAALKQVMLVPEQPAPEILLYGKTGLGKSHGVVVDAWFTGFADTADGRIYVCVYLGETAGENVSGTKAKEIAAELLANGEYLP